MFIHVGIVLTTYLGVRLYEKFKKSELPRKDQEKTDPGEEPSNSSLPQDSGKTEEPESSAEQKSLHYSNVNLAAMGLFAVSGLLPAAGLLGFAAYLYAVIPYMRDVEKSLIENRKVNVDVFFFLGDMLTLGIGRKFTAALGLWMMHRGKLIVGKTKNDSQKKLTDIFAQLPQKVWILIDQTEVEVPLEEVKIKDIVIVHAGGVIPVDGKITLGMASIDQRSLTGESQPAEKGVGDPVFANTFAVTGRIEIRVEKSGQETTASQISEILTHSTDFKSGVQLKGEQWADKATLPMLAVAGLVLPLFGPVPTVVFINSHIGNRIRILAPLGTLNHIADASRKGILIKDGRILENLHQVDTILFDKTGTLTMKESKVLCIMSVGKYEENEILSYAATAEQKQTHPIAQAILKKAEEIHVTIETIHDSEYQIGYGVTVFLKEKTVLVGSSLFLENEGIAIPDSIKTAQALSHEQGNTLILVGINDQIGGAIELQPQLRPEIQTTLDELRQQGIRHMAIVSGDHRGPTQKLAEELGMDDYFYEVLPENKTQIVEQLQQEGRSVCFVGDGINDAIAMKKANASISLSGATTIATDVAEIVFMDGNLSSLPEIFDLSESLKINLNRGLKFTLAPGIVNLSGAFFFHFSILTSLLVSTGFFILALKYALSPLPKSDRKKILSQETQN